VGSSITAVTRSSARLGTEAASVAIRALESVRTEAALRLGPEDARAVSARYVERLLRSDLGVHLARALKRSDPTIDELLAAIEGFVATVPPDLLAGSDALGLDILEPPLRRWPRLRPGARAAYRSLLQVALDADPHLGRHAGNPVSRLALHLSATGTGAASWAAWALAAMHMPGRRVMRKVHRVLGQAVRG
jgi:hypothetical protein